MQLSFYLIIFLLLRENKCDSNVFWYENFSYYFITNFLKITQVLKYFSPSDTMEKRL